MALLWLLNDVLLAILTSHFSLKVIPAEVLEYTPACQDNSMLSAGILSKQKCVQDPQLKTFSNSLFLLTYKPAQYAMCL